MALKNIICCLEVLKVGRQKFTVIHNAMAYVAYGHPVVNTDLITAK
jgi:hypothetical protein